MKILYITEQDLDNNSGVTHKVLGQVSVWVSKGHDVEAVNLNTLQIYNARTKEFGYLGKPVPSHSQLRTFSNLWRNSSAVYDYVCQRDFDVVYTRYFPWTYSFSLIGSRSKLIFEINGDQDEEYKNRSFVALLYYRMTKRLTYLSAKGAIFVSHELSGRFSHHFPANKVIGNGIDDELFQFPITAEVSGSGVLNLVFTGSSQLNWETQNELMNFMAGRNDFHLHVIGNEGINTENVTFYGKVSRQKNLEILAKADVAISTLNFYLRGIHEGSPLKSREYLALGLPMIAGYEDTDLKNRFPENILVLPNVPETLLKNSDRVISFLMRVRGQNREKIRAQVRPFISYLHKEQKRIDFFREI